MTARTGKTIPDGDAARPPVSERITVALIPRWGMSFSDSRTGLASRRLTSPIGRSPCMSSSTRSYALAGTYSSGTTTRGRLKPCGCCDPASRESRPKG